MAKISEKHRNILRELHIGDKNPQYKDGRTAELKKDPERHRLYYTWISIRRRAKARCFKNKPKDRHKKIYESVNVCDEWNDWLVFEKWAIENGWKPGLTIDRIDCDGDYCPQNCRWVSREENNRNRRCVRKYMYNGEELTLGQIARLTGVPEERLYNRVVKYNYTIEDAVNLPPKSGNRFFIP